MSVIRLIMIEGEHASSGLIPATAVVSVLYSIGKGAHDIESFWIFADPVDPTLKEFYNAHMDSEPLLEGCGNGLLVVNWDHFCIESFQEYIPLARAGEIITHNGRYRDYENPPLKFSLGDGWHVLDHNFEESRR